MSWQPTTTIETLVVRGQLLANIRAFFYRHGVLEADVPAIGRATVTDPNIESLEISTNLGTPNRGGHYLQTSPEYYLKRLLAAGMGSAFYLGKAYRADESGSKHNLEFTMLEWYRLGWDDRQLASEVIALIRALSPTIIETNIVSYQSLFELWVGLNPHRASASELAQVGRNLTGVDWQDTDSSLWLDLLFTHIVEPKLDRQLTVVTDFPACQCALAKVVLDQHGQRVAKRFEVYWKGIELANGYWELTDASEQTRRFEHDQLTRQARGLPEREVDARFLAAIQQGLPECAGVALGVDRLLMCLLNKNHINQVLAFADC